MIVLSSLIDFNKGASTTAVCNVDRLVPECKELVAQIA